MRENSSSDSTREVCAAARSCAYCFRSMSLSSLAFCFCWSYEALMSVCTLLSVCLIEATCWFQELWSNVAFTSSCFAASGMLLPFHRWTYYHGQLEDHRIHVLQSLCAVHL